MKPQIITDADRMEFLRKHCVEVRSTAHQGRCLLFSAEATVDKGLRVHLSNLNEKIDREILRLRQVQ